MKWNMEQIPFFPKLVIYGPIISGIFFFVLSFSKKQYSAMVETNPKNIANIACLKMIYINRGKIFVCWGILSKWQPKMDDFANFSFNEISSLPALKLRI